MPRNDDPGALPPTEPHLVRAKAWGKVGVGGIIDFAGRLGGFAQEMLTEASPRQAHSDRLRDLRLLWAESHHRFPPDYFEPGRLEVRGPSWSESDLRCSIDHLPAELQRLLEAFRLVENTLESIVEVLDSLTDSDYDEAYVTAYIKAGKALHEVCIELNATHNENCKILQASRRS